MIRAYKLAALIVIISLLCPLPQTARAAENIAYGKEAYASSKYTEDDSYAPKNVTNGNYNDIWSMGSVTLTGNYAGYQYVAVDLGGDYLIDSVKTVTRRGLDQRDARTGWLIQLSNERDFSESVTIGTVDTPGEYEEDYTFYSEYDTPFRYVRVASPQYIVVAEIEVYGELYDPVTMKVKSEFYDTVDKDYAPAASVMSYLGIMEGVSKNEFAGEALLTRAQAAKIITKFSGLSIGKADEEVFSDVPADHWAADYIYTAHKNGIISTDVKYRPNDYVTDTEFIKLILYSMNYGDFIEYKGGWTGGVYSVSNMLKLKRNVSVNTGDAISRANAAKILYNALLTPRFDNVVVKDGVCYYSESDENALEAVFGLRLTEGLMTENSNTSLIREKESGSGHVKIGNKTYNDPSLSTEFWIGRNIGILTDAENGSEILTAWIIPNKNKTEKIYYGDKDEISDTQYKYYDENEREKRIVFDDNMYVIKNNSAITDSTADDLICPDGYIEFNDNNGNGKPDAAFCFSPRITAVNYISNIEGEISVVSLDGSVISAHDLNYLKITENSRSSTAGRIDKNSLVKVYLSANGKSLWIDSTYEILSGTADSYTDESISIDGREIGFTEYYKANRSKFDDIVLANQITVLLDDRGRLAWIPKDSIVITGETIGFVTKLAPGKEYRDSPEIRIFSQYGTFSNYSFASRINIDGESLSDSETRNMIVDNRLDIEGTFVMFTLNDDGKINSLDTEYAGAEKNSKIVKMNINLGTDKVNMPDTGGIYSQGYQLLPLKKDTLSFIVPWVNGSYGSRDYERYYKVETTERSFLRLSQITDDVDFYGADENNYPAFAVRYKKYSAAGDSGVLEITDEFAPGIIVTEVSNAINDNGELTSLIKGYDIYSGEQTKYYIDPDLKSMYLSDKIQRERINWLNDNKFIEPSKIDMSVISDYVAPVSALKKGDIVRLQIEGGAAVAAERVFEANSGLNGRYDATDDGNWYSAGKSYPRYPSAAFRLSYGTAKEINGDVFIMETCERNGLMQKENVIYSKLKNVFVVTDGRAIEKNYGSQLPSNVDIGDEVVLYTREGPCVSVVVYK